MNRFETVSLLQDCLAKNKWYFVCCRRVQNENYKLVLFNILQKNQAVIKWLSNENMYLNCNEYNMFKIYYTMYLLQFEKKQLQVIEKQEHLKSRDMQNVTYLEINKLLTDLNYVKHEIFTSERKTAFYSGEYGQLLFNIDEYIFLVEISKPIVPKIVATVIENICNGLQELHDYLLQHEEVLMEVLANESYKVKDYQPMSCRCPKRRS